MKFTPDEQKLSNQIILIKNLIEDFRIWTSDIPTNIYLKLTGSDNYHVDDPKQSIASDMFSFIFEKISDLDFPGSSIVGKVLGGMVDYYKQINEKSPDDLPPDIRDVCADLSIRLANTLKQLTDDLSLIEADPAKHWNDTYTIPFGDKSTIVINELINYVIPDKNNPDTVLEYNKIVDSFINKMNYEITKHTVVTTKLYKIGSPQTINFIVGDFQQIVNNPKDFLPDGRGDGDELCFNLLLGVPIWPFRLNVPVNETDPYTKQAIVSRFSAKNGSKIGWAQATIAIDNPATEEDFYKCVKDHIINVSPAVYFKITPTNPSEDAIVYRRFYLITGDSEYKTEENSFTHNATWHTASESLCNFLFIDDGFGNVINENGVAMRQDVFENWGLEGAEGVIAYPDSQLNYN